MQNNTAHFYIDAGEASADVPEGEENKTKDDITVEGICKAVFAFFIYF